MTNPLNPSYDPATLELDAQLDLLVDDELADDDRRTLLSAVDRNPAQWRHVATRFLERQAERKAVRQFIARGLGADPARSTAGPQEIPPTYPFRSRHLISWPTLRNVAAVLVVGTLAAFGGMTFGPHNPASSNVNQPQTASSFSALLPPALTGSADPQKVDVPLVASDQLPEGYPLSDPPHESQGTHYIVITPMGDGRAVMFPVNTMSTAEFH